MDTILVQATDHGRWTRAVADVATDVEDPDDTEAVVLYAFTADDVSSTTANLDLDDGRPSLDELAARKSNVQDAMTIFEDHDIDCRVRGVETAGKDGGHVLHAVDEADADRLYMFSRKRSPAGKAVFGSALQDVLGNSPVPVVVVPSTLA
jgi:nucleotide-binding universal stress UspA family protein